ncbi:MULTISPECIES: type IV pilin N-terminal domain-containing protein [unclassified Methanoculleus]|jgi:FlaG/FlaF family flagellin (archaellin)|uniref:type IV pilin N-terminal domain-containing protein n=1 Tax=unclassified Methanoculleus TaxID=2619537 RepID=UPI00319DA929
MKFRNDTAVSPVIGVMLMLVVTIIIAAVVSGFAGGLVGDGSKNAPSLTMDVKITNTGTWAGSGFSATVTGVSEAIPTKDLRIVTSWRTKMKNNRGTANEELSEVSNGTYITGGNASAGGVANVNVVEPPGSSVARSFAPYGFGIATASSESSERPYLTVERQFGNYTLTPGVSLSAKPYGSKQDGTGNGYSYGYGVVNRYAYPYDGEVVGEDPRRYTDPAQAVLGHGWEQLRSGDIVTVKVIHVPSGKTIWTRDVAVTEG